MTTSTMGQWIKKANDWRAVLGVVGVVFLAIAGFVRWKDDLVRKPELKALEAVVTANDKATQNAISQSTGRIAALENRTDNLQKQTDWMVDRLFDIATRMRLDPPPPPKK